LLDRIASNVDRNQIVRILELNAMSSIEKRDFIPGLDL
jgi:hypothetical protein